MKTVKEFRDLITSEGGEINIGCISIKYQEGQDIDIYACDRIFAWLNSNLEDRQNLSDVIVSVENTWSNPSDDKKLIIDLENKNSDLDKELSVAKLALRDSGLLIGKIEAYEKLLMGRDLTIGK
jgi:uncharacterized protein YwgA